MSKDYQRDEENLSVEIGESHTLKQIFVPILPAVIIIGLIIAIIKILGFVPGLSFTEPEWFRDAHLERQESGGTGGRRRGAGHGGAGSGDSFRRAGQQTDRSCRDALR